MPRRHERALLDALEALEPEAFEGEVWRVTRSGWDALAGSSANGRWSPTGEFEVLYTSLEAEGALAEIGYRLSLEPVWPSLARHDLHRLSARTGRTLRFEAVGDLAPLGVDPARYAGLDYAATQAVAAAAHFLGYDGLIVPSARSPALHLLVLLDHLGADVGLERLDTRPVDWVEWRGRQGRGGRRP